MKTLALNPQISFLWAGLFLLLLPFGVQAADAGPPPGSTLKQFMQQQDQSPGPNVGKPMPANLAVLDRGGHSVELSKVLHRPVVVLKVMDGCPPCGKLLGYVKAHATEYMQTSGRQIAVLTLAPTNADASQAGYPAGVQQFHSQDMLMNSMLGGTTLPTLYFFDKDLILVGVHTGLYDYDDDSMAAALHVPNTVSVP